MTKNALAVGLALLLAGATYAATVVLIKKPVAPTHPADVRLWTNWEVGTAGACTSSNGDCTYTQHSTNEFSKSKVVWGGSGFESGAISTSSSAAKLGSLGLINVDTSDYIQLELNPTDECAALDTPWDCCTSSGNGTDCNSFSPTEGNISFWIRFVGTMANINFFRLRTTSNDEIICSISTLDDMACSWKVTSNTTRTVTTTSNAIAASTWYHVQLIYDQPAPLFRLLVKNEAGGTVLDQQTTSSMVAHPMNTSTSIGFGNFSVTALVVHVDQIVISDDSSADLWTRYGATSTLNYP